MIEFVLRVTVYRKNVIRYNRILFFLPTKIYTLRKVYIRGGVISRAERSAGEEEKKKEKKKISTSRKLLGFLETARRLSWSIVLSPPPPIFSSLGTRNYATIRSSFFSLGNDSPPPPLQAIRRLLGQLNLATVVRNSFG